MIAHWKFCVLSPKTSTEIIIRTILVLIIIEKIATNEEIFTKKGKLTDGIAGILLHNRILYVIIIRYACPPTRTRVRRAKEQNR